MVSVAKGSQVAKTLQARSPPSAAVEAIVNLVLAELDARWESMKLCSMVPAMMHNDHNPVAEHPLDNVIKPTSDQTTVQEVLDGIGLILGNDDDVINKLLNISEGQGGETYIPDLLAQLATRLAILGRRRGRQSTRLTTQQCATLITSTSSMAMLSERFPLNRYFKGPRTCALRLPPRLLKTADVP